MIHSNQKQILLNLHKTVLRENPHILRKDLYKKILKMSGIGEKSVKTIILQYDKNGLINSPNKRKVRTKLENRIDECERTAIRRKIHSFYLDGKLPTINKILEEINNDEDLHNYKRTTLYKVLLEFGFKYCQRGRDSILTERDDLILWRRRYLRDLEIYRKNNRTIYYLDETWLNAGDVCPQVWVDKSIISAKDAFLRGLTTGAPNPSGKGKRLIILHIGSEAGFVPGGLLCFEFKKNSADYHD